MIGPRRARAGGGLLPPHAGFDAMFIAGTLALALGLGAVASVSPAMLWAVVWIDVWLFANPHLVATYTRLGASVAQVRRHWFLVFCLPVLVLAGVTAVALAYEVAGLFTLYFVAQTFHVARQSFGIARAYGRAEATPCQTDGLTEALIYLFPARGLLARCAQGPAEFLGYPLQLPAVPLALANAVGGAAIACAAAWLMRQGRAAHQGGLRWRHDGFVASHVCVSLVAYRWIDDITLGWLVLNLWHNLQYLLFVWAQNLRREALAVSGMQAQTDAAARCRGAVRYGGLCLGVGAALYLAADWLGAQWLWLGLPTVLLAHFTFNFHHYLVDGVIWKRRRRPLDVPPHVANP